MQARRIIQTIDTHTEGEPTRTIVGGIKKIPGATMEEKMEYMASKGDWVRKFICYEPRGNEVMSGAIITEPCDEKADVGVLYFEVGGWMPMCGHDTIGVGTALVEAGIVEAEEPETNIVLDTAAGLIKLKIEIENGRAKAVTFTNAPAFVLKENVIINSQKFGRVQMDIAYGGNIYAIISAESIGIQIKKTKAKELIEAGNVLKEEINNQIKVRHPQIDFEDHVTHVEFYEETEDEEVIRNAVIIPPGAIDRSPCGTGTSAKLSVLSAKGKIKIGEQFIHESIIGSRFICRYAGDTKVEDFEAVIPEVTGRAWVTGLNTFILEPDDIYPEGFQLGR